VPEEPHQAAGSLWDLHRTLLPTVVVQMLSRVPHAATIQSDDGETS
jgi:hypothetical protein